MKRSTHLHGAAVQLVQPFFTHREVILAEYKCCHNSSESSAEGEICGLARMASEALMSPPHRVMEILYYYQPILGNGSPPSFSLSLCFNNKSGEPYGVLYRLRICGQITKFIKAEQIKS